MTVSSTTSRNDYIGNDATSVFAYTFRIIANTDLVVTVRNTSNVETTLTLTTDYTVSGVGSASGGNVTLVNASQAWLTSGNLKNNFRLTIRRVRPVTQTTDIRNQGDFLPEVHEDQFDHEIMVVQQIQDSIARSLKLKETEAGSAALTEIPVAADRASKVLAFNSSGQPIAQSNVPTSGVTATAFAETVLDDTTAATARTTLVISAEVSPASIASSQNNYAGANVDGSIVLARLTASTAINITGLTGGAVDKLLAIVNIGTNAITLTHEDSASMAANRVNVPGGGNLSLSQNESAVLKYDNTTLRWRVIASPLIGTAQIEDNAVTFAKIQDITTARLLGRTTVGSGDAEEVSAGSALSLSALSLNVAADGITATELRDDASVDANRAVTTNHIRDSAVTGAKIASSVVSFDKLKVTLLLDVTHTIVQTLGNITRYALESGLSTATSIYLTSIRPETNNGLQRNRVMVALGASSFSPAQSEVHVETTEVNGGSPDSVRIKVYKIELT